MIRERRWVFRLSLLLFSGLVSLLVVEVALRAIDPLHGRGTLGLARYHPQRESQLVPAYRGRYLGAPVRVDDLGFVDWDRPAPLGVTKPAGTRRIIVFGDSMAFGAEFPIEESFPYFTERGLQETTGTPAWQVIDAGVPGYNAYLEAVYVAEITDVYRPDVVVLQYTLNDADDYRPPPPESGIRAALRPAVDWLRGHSYTYHVVYQYVVLGLLGRFAKSSTEAADSPTASAPPPEVASPARPPRGGLPHILSEYYAAHYEPRSSHFEAARASLLEVDRFLRERRIPLVVVIYPEMRPPAIPPEMASATFDAVYPFAGYHWQVGRVLEAAAHAYLLDALEVIGSLPHREMYQGADHPGPNANRAVANALAVCVRRAAESTKTLSRTVRCSPAP